MDAEIQAEIQPPIQIESTAIQTIPIKQNWIGRLRDLLGAIPVSTFVLGLTLYLISFLLFWGYLVMDITSQQFSFLGKLSGADVTSSEPLTLILLALTGGAVGGVVYSLDKLVKYATKPGLAFDPKHTGDYLVRHLIAAALGAVVFSLVLGGFINVDQLTGTVGAEKSLADQSSGYFAFALGFLTGFGSYQVTKKLDQIIKVAFGRFTEDDLKS